MSYRVYVITANTARYNGEEPDLSGRAVVKTLEQAGYTVAGHQVLPDERKILVECMKTICDQRVADILVTTGGTGFSPEDCTPEATMDILERPALGIPEAMRAHMLKASPLGVLTRATAGIRKKTLIVNLPGTPDIAQQCLAYILPFLKLGVQTMNEGA